MRELTELLHAFFGETLLILPYFLVGVVIEAWIRTKKYHLKIRKTLTRFGLVSVLLASVLGVISPLCACGILPLTISLMLAGLPLAPAMALLIASPLMSPAGYVLSLNNLGVFWANAEGVAAVLMGVYVGLVVHFFETRGFSARSLLKKPIPEGDFHDAEYPDESLRCHCNEMVSKRVEASGGHPSAVFAAKMYEGGMKVGKYALLGIAIEVLAQRYIPGAWIDTLLTSSNPLAVVGITVAAIPLHLTQITASAILFGFSDLAISPAAGMALLIGGPVTALPVMAVFLTLFKPRLFFLYLALCISGTLGVAAIFQGIAG